MTDPVAVDAISGNFESRIAELERAVRDLLARSVKVPKLSDLTTDLGDVLSGVLRGVSPIVNSIGEGETVTVDLYYAYITGPDLTLDGTLVLDGDMVIVG